MKLLAAILLPACLACLQASEPGHGAPAGHGDPAPAAAHGSGHDAAAPAATAKPALAPLPEAPVAPAAERTVFSFDAEREDLDRNGFPDAWQPEREDGFQEYHSTVLDPRGGLEGGAGLRIVFSGGRTGIRSAPLRLDPRFAHDITVMYRGLNLGPKSGHELRLGLRAFAGDGHVLARFERRETAFPADWTRSGVLRVEQLPEGTAACGVFLHLSGRAAGRSMLWLDDVTIQATPRVLLSTGKPFNIFPLDKDAVYEQSVEGTLEGKSYRLLTEVRDFLDAVVDTRSDDLAGSVVPIRLKKTLPLDEGRSGAYTVQSRLLLDGAPHVSSVDLVARDTPRRDNRLEPTFGVLLGRPAPPFGNVVEGLRHLGVSMSKLSILPEDFAFGRFDGEKGFPELDGLLRHAAPDAGYQFIGVLERIPAEARDHPRFAVTPAAHLAETFPTHEEQWKKVLEDLLFHYGNVVGDWQAGTDDTPLGDARVAAGANVLSFLSAKAPWSQVFLPSAWDTARSPAVLHVPASTTPAGLAALLDLMKPGRRMVTLELRPAEEGALRMMEDLVKKVTVLRSRADGSGRPLVETIFVDRLADDERGLMSASYKPRPAYFGMKTLVRWFQDSRYLGRLTLEDKDVESAVFRRPEEAFALLWRSAGKGPARLWLGDKVERMDLMGNRLGLEVAPDHGFTIELGSTPVFVISPHPELLETILSARLLDPPLVAAVVLQSQRLEIRNAFAERAKFDFSVKYPQDWLMQDQVFAMELDPAASGEHKVVLSPSSLAPVDKPVPVHAELDISLEKEHHTVRFYREDGLTTDVQTDVRFFRAEGGLKMDVRLLIDPRSRRPASFTAAALFPDGRSLEAQFRRVQPGKEAIQSLYLRDGEKMSGGTVALEVKESPGDRHVNRSFPIRVVY